MIALSSALLYLLALDALACALVAWGDASASSLAGWALALAGALLLGERAADSFETIEAKRRDRLGLVLGMLQLSVLAIALVLAAGSPTPGLLRFLANLFSGFLLLVLGLARLAPQPRSVLGHAIALAALASFRGGALAAWAAGSTLLLVALYVGLDHHAQRLALHRLDEDRHALAALWRSAKLALPVALAVGLAVRAAPDPPLAGERPELADDSYRPLDEKPKRELDTRALRAILISGLAGAVAVYFVGRLLVRARRRQRRSIETPEPLRGALEPIRPERESVRRVVLYRGLRGRVVSAYLRLLRGAELAGFPKRPGETPDDFASALGEPRQPLAQATAAFVVARYGPSEVSEQLARQAESGAAAVLAHLGRRPPPKREPLVKDAAAQRQSETRPLAAR